MFSLVLVSLGALLLFGSKGKPNTSKNILALPISGIRLSCNKFELTDKPAAIETIVNYMNNFKKMNNLDNYDNIDPLQLFCYIFKQIDVGCYCKFVKKQVTQKEKMIGALFFDFVFNTLNVMVDDSQKFEDMYFQYKLGTTLKFLGLTQEDQETFEKIKDQFELTFSYP